MSKKINLSAKQTLILFITVMIGLNVSPAFAQYSGYYGEGFYGSGDTEFNFFTDLSDFNGDSNFYGITIGRTFNDNVAFEVSYIRFGESESVIANPAVATLDSKFSAQALALTFVGNYPINRSWTVSGKLGINQWDLDAEVVDNTSVPALRFAGKDRGTGINYGIGAQYRITPSYSIKLEYLVYELNPELFADDVVIGGPTVALRFNY